MQIEIESVSIQNFLSFGNQPQVIPFRNGVNLVLGKDISTGRSNGSGKSSFLDAIPYCLFGETHKNIVKEQIINWKNKKNCEVILDFSIGTDKYKVLRAIKPDNLSIFKNEKLIDRDSHIRDYQKVIEEILGMTFPTFCNLVHNNINASNKILAMKKPEKRKFMEDVFGLQVYSELNTKANEKIRGLNNKMNEIDVVVNSSNASLLRIEEQSLQINDKIKNLGSSDNELRDAEEAFSKMTEDFANIDQIISIGEEKIRVLTADHKSTSVLSTKVEAKASLVERWIKEVNTKLDDVQSSEKYKKDYLAFARQVGSPDNIKEKIDVLQIEKTKAESDYMLNDGKLKTIQISIATVKANKKTEEERLKRLVDHNECPTCGQSLIGKNSSILQDMKDRLEMFTKELETYIIEETMKKDVVNNLYGLKSKLQMQIEKLSKDKDYLYGLKDKIKSAHDEKKLIVSKARYQNVVKCLTACGWKLEEKLKLLDKDTHFIESELDEVKSKKVRIESHKNKIEAIKSRIDMEKRARAEFIAIIETNKQNMLTTQGEIKSQQKRKETYANLIDYLEIIKEICKDENLKQYAISSIMPFLNKQTNHYLSEVGYGFFAIIDKWLEAEIKGPGITKASYGSLSGGESKGIDLAIQFGLLDIAKIQAGRWPDILIMDEILDSSVDGRGIGKIMEIIRAKQIEDNNKIFIISHREELSDDFEADCTYYVEKENGYSKVTIQ